MAVQSRKSLEEFYETPDPWGYEDNVEDQKRRSLLTSVIPSRDYARVLDIGSGTGFVTHALPGESIVGIDLSAKAVSHARETAPDHVQHFNKSLFDLPDSEVGGDFDLVVITGVLYSQYIGEANQLVRVIVDDLLVPGGVLVCTHIYEWLNFRFPYTTLHREYYPYRDYTHVLEVYKK